MEHHEFVLLTHHLIIIVLASIIGVLWVKIKLLKEGLERLEKKLKSNASLN